MPAYCTPVTLAGSTITLEPLTREHAPDLLHALNHDEEIWRYIPVEQPQTLDDMGGWIATALAEHAQGQRLPFAVIHIVFDPRRGMADSQSLVRDATRRSRLSMQDTGQGSPPDGRPVPASRYGLYENLREQSDQSARQTTRCLAHRCRWCAARVHVVERLVGWWAEQNELCTILTEIVAVYSSGPAHMRLCWLSCSGRG
jgi:hypothetical protein